MKRFFSFLSLLLLLTITTSVDAQSDLKDYARLTIIVKDAATDKPIANAKVNLTDCNETGYFETDANGRFETSKLAKLPCEFIIEPAGYIAMNIYIQKFGERPEEFEIQLTKASESVVMSTQPAQTGEPMMAPSVSNLEGAVAPPTTTALPPTNTTTSSTPTYTSTAVTPGTRSFTGSVINSVNSSRVTDVIVTATNQGSSQRLETMTDTYGNYYLSMDKNASYLVSVSKKGYTSTDKVIETSDSSSESLGALMIKPSGDNQVASSTTAANPSKKYTPAPKAKANKKYTAKSEDMDKEGKFSIQLAAVKGKSKLDVAQFDKLKSFGDLYQTYEKGYTKLRLGFFSSKSAAKTAVNAASKRGFSNTHIVDETNRPASYNTAVTTTNKTTTAKAKYTKYKVRLASLTKPKNFKPSTVSRFGTIEKVKKNKYTIFLLSGYSSKASARDALIRARKAGFPDAQLVIDNNGKLTQIK